MTLTSLPPERWERWVPIILAYPDSWEDGETSGLPLVALAYRTVPDAVAAAAARLVRRENCETPDLTPLRRLRSCWDARLTGAVLGELSAPGMGADALQRFLEQLIKDGVAQASVFAASLAAREMEQNPNGRERVAAAAAALLGKAGDAGWPVVWPLMNADAELGRQVVQRAVGQSLNDGPALLGRLGVRELADLYIWLFRHHPTDDPTDAVYRFRGRIMETLAKSGTREACTELRRVVAALPEADWLKSFQQDAEASARQATWSPPEPNQILELMRSEDRCLVLSKVNYAP